MNDNPRYRRHPSQLLPEPPPSGTRTFLPSPDINSVFTMELANDQLSRMDCHTVRWKVFCQEGIFTDQGASKLETDDMDPRSLQVICYHRASRIPCATFRLVLCDAANPFALFPIEEKTDLSSLFAPFRTMPARRLGITEISRFCILKEFRQGLEEGSSPPPGIDLRSWSIEWRHRLGLAGFLWLGVAELVSRLGLDFLFALMETRLARLAAITGVIFDQLGPEVPRPGAMRAPFMTNRRYLKSLLANANAARVTAGFSTQFVQAMKRNHLLDIYTNGSSFRLDPQEVPC